MHHYRKQLLDKFSENLKHRFHNYCQLHEQEQNLEKLIIFLIDQDLISSSAIRKYTINEEFEKLFAQKKHKTKTVNILADKFNISERSVWLALKAKRDAKK